jgi:hypothetical protein
VPDVYRSKVKVSGEWRTVSATYVKVDGTWNLATGVKSKVNGAWVTVYPYPLSADTTLTNLTVNGTSVANGGTYPVNNDVTSVTIAATIPAGATATGLGAVSVSYAGNPNTKNIVVTAENGVNTATYSVNISVAAPAPTGVTIYFAYCTGVNTSTSGGSFMAGYTDITAACNQAQANYGYPFGWACGGSQGVVPSQSCAGYPCTACCQDTGAFTCGPYGVNRVRYIYAQYDPCCGTTCPNRVVIEDGNICIGE